MFLTGFCVGILTSVWVLVVKDQNDDNLGGK